MSSADSSSAQKRWELENGISEAEASVFRYDEAEQRDIRAAKPWDKDPKYFQEVRISALALLKMVIHARSGGNLEVMGLLQGKVEARVLVVLDVFALPVEGTETRVNAQAQAYEYMTTFTEACSQVGRLEKVLGWYHSHPGYGCWLSGIDVSTQMLNQQYQEPWLAIVVDPIRTAAAGKVDLGAFRTYPKGYKPPDQPPSEYQSIPLNKIEDFGVHASAYYSLHVSYFKSALDARLLDSLWHKYWAKTLSSTPLLASHAYVTAQIHDVAGKLEGAEVELNRPSPAVAAFDVDGSGAVSKLAKVEKDAVALTAEQLSGLISQLVKHRLFNCDPTQQPAGKDDEETKKLLSNTVRRAQELTD